MGTNSFRISSRDPAECLVRRLFENKKLTVQYPGFWKQAQKKIALTEATMVRIFKPGERIEIDYADGIEILDPVTGELRKTELFVGLLCHSRYAFAEFRSQSSSDFLQSHVNMFGFFGGRLKFFHQTISKVPLQKHIAMIPLSIGRRLHNVLFKL